MNTVTPCQENDGNTHNIDMQCYLYRVKIIYTFCIIDIIKNDETCPLFFNNQPDEENRKGGWNEDGRVKEGRNEDSRVKEGRKEGRKEGMR